MVTAPVKPERLIALRTLLASMNVAPGVVDPENQLVPFRKFRTIHVARFVVLEDPTLGDRAIYPQAWPAERIFLAFLGDCDGPGDRLLEQLARDAGPGLQRIFAHCDGFEQGSDLLAWMRAHETPPATIYVNWAGRTVQQIAEEAALHAALSEELVRAKATDPRQGQVQLCRAVRARGLTLSPLERPSPGQKLAYILELVSVPLLLLLLSPLLIVIAPFFLLALRRRERSDPVIEPRLDLAKMRALDARDDHDVTNPFSAIGSLKPGSFRRWLTTVVLWLVNWSARTIYRRGRLARVGTIHFARWVLLDNGRRLFFASNYDGNLESYMDDFINKVAFGLNLVFSNGVGYPRTDFMIVGGAQREQQFKRYLRHHQILTDVWYKAYSGLTTRDLARNGRIRAGFDRGEMSADDARRWLAEIQ